MRGRVVDADYELADLEGCQGLLNDFGDADAESGYGVVGVLDKELAWFRVRDDEVLNKGRSQAREKKKLTIIA